MVKNDTHRDSRRGTCSAAVLGASEGGSQKAKQTSRVAAAMIVGRFSIDVRSMFDKCSIEELSTTPCPGKFQVM